jgi:hypothetical protein
MTTKNDVTGDEIKSRVQTSSEYQDNWDNIFVGKAVPLGEDTTPKDRVKLGLSPSTIVEEWDCRPTKESLLIKVEAAATKYKDEIARCSDSAYEDHPHLQVLYNDYMEAYDECHEFSFTGVELEQDNE